MPTGWESLRYMTLHESRAGMACIDTEADEPKISKHLKI